MDKPEAVRAELKSLDSADAVDGLDHFQPADPSVFSLSIGATIGLAGEEGGDLFYFNVATAAWFANDPPPRALHKLAEAERAFLRRAEVDFGIQREIAARIQAEDQAVVEFEQGDGTARSCPLIRPRGPDDSLGPEAKAVTVEGECPLEISTASVITCKRGSTAAHLLV